jgi:hypothetical protein
MPESSWKNQATNFKWQQKLKNQLGVMVSNDKLQKRLSNKKSFKDSSFNKLAAQAVIQLIGCHIVEAYVM